MDEGAVKLQKVLGKMVKRLEGERESLPNGVIVSRQAENLLRISSPNKHGDQRSEFSFLIRVTKTGPKEIWWPVEYVGPDQTVLRCETTINGRRQVNIHKQASLVELANTWAGTLEAQSVAKSVNNALL